VGDNRLASDPLIPIVLAGIAAAVIDLAMLWFCARAVGRSPLPTLTLAAIVLVVAAALMASKVAQERSRITSITYSPDLHYEAATYVEKRPGFSDLTEWTVYARPSAFRLLQRGEYIFYAWNLSRLETRWDGEGLLVLCDCSAGVIWEVKQRWGTARIKIVEVPSTDSDHLPQRPNSVPGGANRAGGKWIYCETARSREAWNLCSVYADKTGALIVFGRYWLRGQQRAAIQGELQYVMYENVFDKPQGGWIYLKDGILEIVPIVQKPIG